MSDIINFYSKIDKKTLGGELPKKWKAHHIFNNSMMLVLGGTGTGKSNFLLNYIHKSSGEFYEIIICSFSTIDEPLYKFLKQKEKNIELINDINEVPELSVFDNKDKDKPKLIVFDDFINLNSKQMKKINEYLVAGRKMGFTVILLAQNYVSVPKIITRNIHYFVLFKINDNVSIDRIIKNHNIDDVDGEMIKQLYKISTAKPFDFFMIDLKTQDKKEKLRHNFLDFFKI